MKSFNQSFKTFDDPFLSCALFCIHRSQDESDVDKGFADLSVRCGAIIIV